MKHKSVNQARQRIPATLNSLYDCEEAALPPGDVIKFTDKRRSASRIQERLDRLCNSAGCRHSQFKRELRGYSKPVNYTTDYPVHNAEEQV